MKKTRFLIIPMIAIAMVMGMISYGVAASISTKIELPKEKAKVGEDIKIKVKFSGKSLGRVRALIEYDNEKIAYVSGGDSEGDNGLVSISKAGTGSDIVVNLKFKGKKTGDANIKVTEIEAYDLDEQLIDGSKPKVSLKIYPGDKKEKKPEKKVEKKQEENIDKEKTEPEKEESFISKLTQIKYFPIYASGIGIVVLLLILVIAISGRKKK